MPEVMRDEGIGLIEFSAARVEFMKGNIDHAYFLNEFRKIVDDAETLENKLTLKINILFFELAKGMETGIFPSYFEKQVTELHQEIEAADVPEYKKHLLRCHHADSQYHFAVRGEAALYREVKLREAMHVPMPVAEKISRTRHYFSLIDAADKAVYEAYLFGRDNDLSLLKATAAHQMGQHFLARRINLLMINEQDKMPQNKAHLVEVFDRNQNYSLIAYNEFLKLNMFQNAHEALAVAYDINQMCIYLTGTPVGTKTTEELLIIIRQIEESFELQPFQSGMAAMAEKLNEMSTKNKPK